MQGARGQNSGSRVRARDGECRLTQHMKGLRETLRFKLTMIDLSLLAGLLLVGGLLFRSLRHRLRTRSIAHLPSPPPGSWLTGMVPSLFQSRPNLL